MRVDLLRRRWTDSEAAVHAGVIAVIQAHNIHEDDVAGLQQPVRTQVRVRVGAIARCDLHIVNPLRAEAMHFMRSNGLQVVLFRAGANFTSRCGGTLHRR